MLEVFEDERCEGLLGHGPHQRKRRLEEPQNHGLHSRPVLGRSQELGLGPVAGVAGRPVRSGGRWGVGQEVLLELDVHTLGSATERENNINVRDWCGFFLKNYIYIPKK